MIQTNEKFSLQGVATAIQKALHPLKPPFSLHQPSFEGNEWRYVKNCLDTGWVSSAGQYVDEFEQKIATYASTPYAIAVVNGTAALHVGLQLLDVRQGDEVLAPALTFVATINAISYCGAIPHFIDSDANTLGIDVKSLGVYLKEETKQDADGCINKTTGRRIKALIAVHTFGHPVDLDPLAEVCSKYKIHLIEDAAEALGSFYKKSHVGNRGKLSILSFNGNKIVTTGGGGAILTADKKIARQAKHLTTTAKMPHPWALSHDETGYNYRLPNLNAALGCAQLEQVEQFVKRKRTLATKYERSFLELEGVSFFKEPDYARSNYWLQTLILDSEYAEKRNEILEFLNNGGYGSRPAWTLMHQLPMYQQCPRMETKIANQLAARIINIPSSSSLVRDEA